MDWMRRILTVAFVVALLLPVFGLDDGVPLSSYPMYARPRASALVFVVPMALDEDGAARALTTQTIASTSDPLIAESYLRDAADRDADALCREIASRVDDGDVREIVIRRETHDVVGRALGEDSLIAAVPLTRCSVR